MIVIAAPFTASCLSPDAVPDDLSNSLVASAMAREMRLVWLLLEPVEGAEDPLVNCFKTYFRSISMVTAMRGGIDVPA